MQPAWLSYKDSRIAYYRFGQGPKPVICLHGYGETGASFAFLPASAAEFSFIAIDLPFHGQTVWEQGFLFTPADLQAVIEGIVEQEATGHSGFSLLGFSLGGRMALSLYEQLPARINRMVLLAPDGLKVNGWYWLATQTWLGNRFFALTMRYPRWFFFLLKLLNKMGLVNSSIFKFVHRSIGDKQVRQLLYQRWTAFRKIKPAIPSIKQFITQQHTPVRLLYGRHDRIIVPAPAEKFKQGIENWCTLTLLSSGHQVLQEKYAAAIITALRHTP